MQESSRRAAAAFGLAALVFALALADGEPPPADCPAPHERRALGGHSVSLGCRPGGGAAALRGPARRLLGLPIDPNRADAATLETLPGVGPARAAAILAARARRPFARVEELDRVPGIGPRTLAGIAGLLGVEAQPAPGPEPPLGPSRPDPVGCAEPAGSAAREGDS
jgi:competence protein ComEA